MVLSTKYNMVYFIGLCIEIIGKFYFFTEAQYLPLSWLPQGIVVKSLTQLFPEHLPWHHFFHWLFKIILTGVNRILIFIWSYSQMHFFALLRLYFELLFPALTLLYFCKSDFPTTFLLNNSEVIRHILIAFFLKATMVIPKDFLEPFKFPNKFVQDWSIFFAEILTTLKFVFMVAFSHKIRNTIIASYFFLILLPKTTKKWIYTIYVYSLSDFCTSHSEPFQHCQ